jgi:hypothetical protein
LTFVTALVIILLLGLLLTFAVACIFITNYQQNTVSISIYSTSASRIIIIIIPNLYTCPKPEAPKDSQPGQESW